MASEVKSKNPLLPHISRDRKFGERRHWAVSLAFVVVRCTDLFARRLHCQLASLALG